MERDEAVTELPVVYRQIVELLDAGCTERQIGDRLGVDPPAVASLVAIARAKLARLTGTAREAQ